LERPPQSRWMGSRRSSAHWYKPNPGHFAEKPKDPNLPARRGWPLPAVNEKVKEWIAEAAENIIPKAGRFLLDGLPIVDAISTFVSVLEPTDLNGGEDRLVAQMRTSFDPPKTLQELQQTPTENILGYEQHHIVEQTPDNIKKASNRRAIACRNSAAKRSTIRAISSGCRGSSMK